MLRPSDRAKLARLKGLVRSKGIAKVNHKRKAKRVEAGEVYGPYHRAVKGLPCVVAGRGCAYTRDRPTNEGHHVRSVAAGGKDRGNEVTVCPGHHDEIHGKGRRTFEAKYDVSLTAEAARVSGMLDGTT